MFAALVCLLTFIYFSSAQDTVTTTAGPVISTLETVNAVKYKAYSNIPYALSPVGSLRFKAPAPISTISTARINVKTGNVTCPQLGLPTTVTNSEDCLILNVYTPQDATATSSYPVMVWIHGGFYESGYSAFYQPELFVDQKVLLVTLNYRLGALGFLSLGDSRAPGNAGLKDQLLALNWVKNEIIKFGGNPNKITIFGQNAGAASVHHHVLSTASKGLFQQAIMQSGTVADWSYLESGFVERATAFANRIGCVDNNAINQTCLETASVEDIIYNQDLELSPEDIMSGNIISFPPVKEATVENVTAFQQNSLANLINTVANPVPTLIGINKQDGLFLVKQSAPFFNSFYTNLMYLIPQETRTKLSASVINDRVAKLKSLYFTNRRPPTFNNYDGYANLYTDKLFAVSSSQAAVSILSKNITNVYLYRFEYDGGRKINTTDEFKLGVQGVTHGDELCYLFPISTVTTDTSKATNDTSVAATMVQLWTTFANTGIPTTTSATPIKWNTITSTNQIYLSITSAPTMSTTNLSTSAVISLWNDVAMSSGSFHQPMFSAIASIVVVTKLFFF